MVFSSSYYRYKIVKVKSIGSIVSFPSINVERRILLFSFVELALFFGEYSVGFVEVYRVYIGYRGFEVFGVS